MSGPALVWGGATLWAHLVLGAVLVVAAVTDVRSGRIYNWLTYPAVALGLVGHTLLGGIFAPATGYPMSLTASLVGLAVGFGPLLAAWMAGGIGGGDAKLMAAVGALAGWRFAIAAMFYGFAVAAVMAIIVMLHRRVTRRTLKRVFRFLVLLATPGRAHDPASEDSPKIPFGLALCIGSGVALIEVLLRGPMARKLLLGV
jgi:prepilin peptidase CpaA